MHYGTYRADGRVLLENRKWRRTGSTSIAIASANANVHFVTRRSGCIVIVIYVVIV